MKQVKQDFQDYSDGKVQISVDQWRYVLNSTLISEKGMDILSKIYVSPNHAASCKQLGDTYQVPPKSFIMPVVAMGRKIAAALGVPKLTRKDSEYWPVLFLGREGKYWEWQMRPELVEAFEECCAAEIKQAERAHVSLIGDDEVWEKARTRSGTAVKRYHVTSTRYQRDPYVSEVAQRRAKGVCALCGKNAPFLDKKGNPYLETHHVVWLARGGEDSIQNVVALCPNCHRKAHTLDTEEDIQFLKRYIQNCLDHEPRKA